MCGIAGVLALDWARDRAERALTRMGDAIAHRGPDGSGLHWDAGVGIAMRRLAIVDIAGGQQPMASDDGQVWLVYNGEIFNAPAIRRHLIARGHRFRSRSDTEVILRLYLDRGLDFAESMRGMWALAIHDKRQRRVILSRDRLGIKPLHVLELGRSTLFASELRAFRSVETDLAAGVKEIEEPAFQWDPTGIRPD